jgi:acetolactate synthase small subunit
MNGDRSEFSSTPAYDEFLEKREDLITKFLELYDTSGSMGREASSSREELEKILHKFEVDNQEKIIHARNTAEDRKRRKIEHIIEVEGTLFDRINVEYHERSSVIDHELAVHYADLLSQKEGAEARFTQHASADLLNRRTRLIQQQPQISSAVIISQPVIAEASGCKDLWKKRALDVITKAFLVDVS